MEFGIHRSSFPSYYNSGSSSSRSGPSHHQHSQRLPASGSGSSAGDTGTTDGGGIPGGFDVIAWYPRYQSCQRYFVEVAQHSYACQALAAFINIKLPFQRVGPHNSTTATTNIPTAPAAPSQQLRPPPPVFRYPPPGPLHPAGGPPPLQQPHGQSAKPHPPLSPYGWVSLFPYIRRLVVTGFDAPGILHGWFGDDWETGVGPQHEQERRNYLFAAKSGGWAAVKRDYDVVVDECVPYLQPLRRPGEGELEGAEETWSGWLAMEDWMLGERAPGPVGYHGG